MSDSLPHSLFCTSDLPSHERFAAWKEDISVIFDVEQPPGIELDLESFHATFNLYNFGRSVLGGLTSSSARYVRSRKKAARDCLDAILIQLFVRGSVQFGVGKRITHAKAGDIVIFDLAQPVDNINLEFDHITSMWPRSAVEELIPNIANWHGLSLPRKSPVTRLLRQHMISSHKLAKHLVVPEGQRVEEATLSLVSAAVAKKTYPRNRQNRLQ